ncbi:UNKNOWN [Stylonychia lemnae]|uniref:Cilia- and flagella-associated protein 36 n=1 Tax=Stylonychia lemnae TaxID=5949 RepID=A0A077ZPP9_STYLE|nr:UNKNOWN [Stylonychia lemnae]|eukprot:CDW71873.1 UNKNOWN [Stylonychia lemnae]
MSDMLDDSQLNGNPTAGVTESENDWFFDLIITFLKSPRWKTPILSFLDEHCVIFDNDDENKLEYTIIHNDFKKIVDELLCELMAELDITQEQFMEACDKAQENPIHKKVVDQLIAVDNFMAFRKLMIKRNSELNEEALKLMLEREQKQVQLKLAEQITQQQEQQQQQKQQETVNPTQTAGGTIIHQGVDLEELRREQMEYELALQMSMVQEEETKHQDLEEEEMLKMVMEMSIKEEEARKAREEEKEVEQKKQLEKIEKKSLEDHELQQKRAQESAKILEKAQQESLKIEAKVEVQQEELQVQQQVQINTCTAVQEEEKKESPKKEKTISAPKQSYNLPPVSLKKGGGAFDPDLLKDQKNQILKGLNSMDEELALLETRKKNDDFDGKTMAEVLKQKREETEKILENTKINQQESMEDRRLRLRANRDMLLKMKKEQRQQELDDFKGKVSNKQDLHKELKEIDQKIKAKEQIKKIEENFDFETMEGSEQDKRLALYRNLRENLQADISNASQSEQRAKMDEVNKKIQALEKAKKERDQRDLIQKEAIEQARQDKNKGFLSGIKSYSIEDI